MAKSSAETDDRIHANFPTTSSNTEHGVGRCSGSQSQIGSAKLPPARCRDPLQASHYPTNSPHLKTRIRYNTICSAAYLLMAAVLTNLMVTPASAVFISYQNCLPQTTQNGQSLQVVPLFVDAVFDTKHPSHNLNITVWGNVTGSLPQVELPLGSNTSYWNNPNFTDGKIVDVPSPDSANPLRTTFFRKVNILTYQPYQAPSADFCESLINATCPLGPVFAENASV